MNYLCRDCKNNNNGWCVVKRMNGLKNKNIIDCENYKGDNTIIKISKDKDGMNIDHLTILINGESAFIPTHIIHDFILSESKNILITIHS